MSICLYTRLIAAYHVLLRLREPRHPSCALLSFPFISTWPEVALRGFVVFAYVLNFESRLVCRAFVSACAVTLALCDFDLLVFCL